MDELGKEKNSQKPLMKNQQAKDLKMLESSPEYFLSISSEFKLGALPTETPNPRTLNLSNDAKTDLCAAIDSIKKIDEDVFEILNSKLPDLENLKQAIEKTLKEKNRIFLCGCGATGRLSLALETIWRQLNKDNRDLKDKVISFMAGGDVALIHSVEKFEDFPEFGERQLMELGFREGDLLISTTEGGETPFVIGATEKASLVSSNRPFILYCNPDEILVKTTKRSRDLIENSKINKINLTVGPMALTGSTRMQATTILMYGVGLALVGLDRDFNKAEYELQKVIEFIKKCDFNFLIPFIERETEIYQRGEYLLYETDASLGISILTDTTERSPTFSLYPFENQNSQNKNPSLSYLYFKDSMNAKSAWSDLLKREPRTFFWKEVTDQTSADRLFGFDFSEGLAKKRTSYTKATNHHFKIYYNADKNHISFSLNEIKHTLDLENLNFLSVHIVLKVLLNNLSTLIMGRMGRYESNLMTWVRASNNKLIDRAVRYAIMLLAKDGIEGDYEKLVHLCFDLKDKIARDDALVLRMVERYKNS